MNELTIEIVERKQAERMLRESDCCPGLRSGRRGELGRTFHDMARKLAQDIALRERSETENAIIADKVRNLVMRASDVAKNASKAVRNGNELTNATREVFKENTAIAMKVGPSHLTQDPINHPAWYYGIDLPFHHVYIVFNKSVFH